MNVVLDKSFLRGAGRTKVCGLCESHNVLMPEALFFELLTTSKDKDRAICFSNLPEKENPVALVQGVSAMLGHEISKREPVGNISGFFIDIPYVFNNGLKKQDFQFADGHRQNIAEWQEDVALRVEGFKEKAACVSGWFPRIKDYIPGMNPKDINEAKSLICEDLSVVREIYKVIRFCTFPEAEMLTQEWAMTRYLQVHILAALEYVRMFGDGNSAAISAKIENEILDLDYCITALLVGALASHDNRLIEKFEKILPTGIVISQTSVSC
jgi:hypothetical protein